MLNKKYHGLFKRRKDVEEVMGNDLPATAQIVFAHLIRSTVPDMTFEAMDEHHLDLLVFWTLDKKFFTVVGQQRVCYDPKIEQWVKSQWQKQSGRLDNIKGMLAVLDEAAERNGWPANYAAAFKEAFKAMSRMEDAWDKQAMNYVPPVDTREPDPEAEERGFRVTDKRLPESRVTPFSTN